MTLSTKLSYGALHLRIRASPRMSLRVHVMSSQLVVGRAFGAAMNDGGASDTYSSVCKELSQHMLYDYRINALLIGN